jgi:hypothetical protein
VQLEHSFILGKTNRILDKAYPYRPSERSSNGDRLLSLLKKNTNVISEDKKGGGGNKNKFHNNSLSIHNLYEYKGLVLTVTASSPSSGRHTFYEFVCSSNYR